MKFHPLATPSLLFVAALVGASCSSGTGDTGDDDPASGGSATGGTTDGGTGGASPGDGGQTGNTGGSATGGTSNDGFTCPSVPAGSVPSLSGKTTALVAAAPDMTGGEAQVFLEGPVWADGKLYVSQLRKWGDAPPARILVLEGASLTEFIPDSGTNGLAWDGSKLIAASHKEHGIVSFTLADKVQTVLENEYGEPPAGFNSPNDLVLRNDGNVYFTDPNWQCGSTCPQGSSNTRIYRIAPDGTVTATESNHPNPNGIALSLDQNTLYVGGNGTGPDQGIESFPLAQDGAVGARTLIATSVGASDGMTLDCAGNLYVTTGKTVVVVKPDGSVLPDTISVPAAENATNVAFGGPENKTLYVTTYSKELHSVELDVPGYPY